MSEAAMAELQADAPARVRRRRRGSVIPYLFIAPNLLLFSTFVFAPLLYAAYISVHEWSLLGDPRFIGVTNYRRIATDPLFWTALTNTVLYSLGTVPASLALGLLLALGLNRNLPGRTILRSAYFLPVVISSVVTAVVLAWLFNENYGVVNQVLRTFGLGPVPWLSSPAWALPCLVLTTLWIRIGFCMVVYLAALQGIPAEYYAAAQIDGANRRQQFRHVTWPLLAPATFLLLVLNVIYSFQVFDLVFVMTGGGPGFSTTMLVQYIYQTGFVGQEMGYASAIGMVLFLLVLCFTLLQWRLGRQSDGPD